VSENSTQPQRALQANESEQRIHVTNEVKTFENQNYSEVHTEHFDSPVFVIFQPEQRIFHTASRCRGRNAAEPQVHPQNQAP
jgi:hypothetical protein